MKTGIYMIRNKVNNKAYIGQAIDIDRRWGEHIWELNNNKHYNIYLQRAWNKYGTDNFEFTIIHECDEELLDELEIMYIAHFDTYNNGYNLTLGGEGAKGYRLTDEQRDKLSEALKEYCKDPEVRKKRSEAMKGDKNPSKRPEVKAKLSEAMKEYCKDPEVRKKRSESRKGKPKSEEHKAKLSESRKGKCVKAVYCVTNNTIYASTVEAEEKLLGKFTGGTVSWACKGKYEWGNGHVYKKLGLEFWYLDEWEGKFGKVAM